jgi:hypothetical protein
VKPATRGDWAWDTDHAVVLLSERVSTIATIRQAARAAGVPAGEMKSSYENAETAWHHMFFLADERGRRHALEDIVRARWPTVAAPLDNPKRSRLATSRIGKPLPWLLAAIAGAIVAVANARTAFAGLPTPVIGASCGLMVAAAVTSTEALADRRHLTLLIVCLLVGGGVAAGAVLQSEFSHHRHYAPSPIPSHRSVSQRR